MPASGKAELRLPLLLGGLAALVAGLVAFGYGLAPMGELADTLGPVFSGGTPPEDLGERMDASFAKLGDRVVWDGVGFVGIIAGIILMKSARKVPKPRALDEIVHAAVEDRLRSMGVSNQPAPAAPTVGIEARPLATQGGSRPAPALAPTVAYGAEQVAQVVAPRPAPPATASPGTVSPLPTGPRICPSCGGRLVAGGRICSSCRQMFP